jgi:hypothetical protein
MIRILTLIGVAAAALAVAGAVSAQDDDYGYGYGSSPPASPSSPPAAQPAAASGEVYKYTSPMNVAQEVPKPKAPAGAKGSFTATVTESGSAITLKWKLMFSGLSGKAVAAHIHKGKKGKAGPVLVALCGPCRSGQTGTMKIAESANSAIEGGATYVNVHTAKNAGGEIRGQVKLVSKT